MRRAAVVLPVFAAGCGGSSEDRSAKRSCEPTNGSVEPVVPPLVVTGVVRGDDCAPLAGATISAHQTNGKGRYGPVVGGDDRCCYLAGTVRTGDDGRSTLDTVMPRGYEGGPPHIHMDVGHPDAEGVATELVLDGPVKSADFDIVLRVRSAG